MWTLENSRQSYFFHQHRLINVSDDVISLCVRGSELYRADILSVHMDEIVGAPLFMKGKWLCWTAVKKQCLIFFFFKYIVSFARFKLFQWPLWGFLSWTEGYQQFCSRVRVLGSIFPLLGLKWQISSGWFKNTWGSGSSSYLMLTFVPVLFCSWPPDGWISAGLWLATVMEDCAGMAAWNQRRKKKEGKKKRKVQITITYVPPQVLTAQ